MIEPGKQADLGDMAIHIGADTAQLERQIEVLTIGLENVAAALRGMRMGLERARKEPEP